MTARDIGKTAPRGREAPLLDLALVSNSGISLPYPRYIRKATVLACPSQVRATSPVKRPRLWGSGVRAPVALICQYIDRHKERFAAWPICRVLSDSGTKIAPATALHHTTGHYPPGRSRDHPRSRGVYRYSRARGPRYGGSSPLARGLPGSGGELSGGGGIIPARAGFTGTAKGMTVVVGDHPRSRGVYIQSAVRTVADFGSSPLARGLRAGGGRDTAPVGIIPARAGFTLHPPGIGPGRGDHPRSRGVYQNDPGPADGRDGSSPLARGLRRRPPGLPLLSRIIPARAGFTPTSNPTTNAGPDHPRSRGVYRWLHAWGFILEGSSPLARGLPLGALRVRFGARIIPARAGFTILRICLTIRLWDHPRSRGVYVADAGGSAVPVGSSPLARGLPPAKRTACPTCSDHPRSRGVYGIC